MRQLKITTAGQAVFHLRAAGLATRAAAWLCDQAILLAVRLAALYAFAQAGAAGVKYILPLFVLLELAYYLYFEQTGNGQTPGKRRFRLRVVRSDGDRLDFQAVLLRNVVRIVDTMPLLMVAGGLCSWLEPLGRRLGDLAAGTMVVRERDSGFVLPPADRDRPNTFQETPALRRRILARASREERDLAIDLMWRRDGLRPETREELFRLLADMFRRRFSLPEDDSLSDEQMVMGVAMVLVKSNEQC